MRRKLLALAGLLMLWTTSVRAESTDAGLVAVLPLHTVGGVDTTAREMLEETLFTIAGEQLSPFGYVVLSKETQLRVLEDNGIDPEQACEASCALGVAKELKATLFVSGSISHLEDSYAGIVRVYETAGGRQVGAIHLEGSGAMDIRRQLLQQSQKLFSRVERRSGAAGTVTVDTVVPQDRTENRSDSSTQTRAIPGFVDILVRDPDGQPLQGARISVGGQVEGTAPRSLPLTAGVHTITVEKDLYFAKSVSIELGPGETKRLEFELHPDFGHLTIETEPTGAVVTLDGVALGSSPLRNRAVRTGEHRLRLEMQDYLPEALTVSVAPGERKVVRRQLTPDFGPLSVRSDPSGAEVLLDGRRVGTTPLKLDRVRPGRHELEVRAAPESYDPFRTQIIIERESGAPPVFARLERREADLIVSTNPPGATVFLNGARAGTTTLRTQLLGGTHELRLKLDGYVPESRHIRHLPPEPTVLTFDLRRGGTGRGGRFTLADLGLSYKPVPDEPSYERVGTVTKKKLKKSTVSSAFIYGMTGLSLAAMPFLISDEPDGSMVGLGLVLAGVGVLIPCISGNAWTSTSVPDEAAKRRNQRKRDAWQAERQRAIDYNRSVDAKLREANAELDR